jgi:hypothetical protein
MSRTVRGVGAAILIACTTLFLSSGAGSGVSAAGTGLLGSRSSTCSGGPIAPGNYGAIVVRGICWIPNGVVNVSGYLSIAPGAALDAATHMPILNVAGNVKVGPGATLLLGSSPELSGGDAPSDHIGGSIFASMPLAVILHNNFIGGNVSLLGGGAGVNCTPSLLLSDLLGFPAPVFSVLEDNQIGGNVTVQGYKACWFGVIRNHIAGTATLLDNTLADPDAMEVVTNVVGGNLVCYGNTPPPQVGDSEGGPNVVAGETLGQCAHILPPPPVG